MLLDVDSDGDKTIIFHLAGIKQSGSNMIKQKDNKTTTIANQGKNFLFYQIFSFDWSIFLFTNHYETGFTSHTIVINFPHELSLRASCQTIRRFITKIAVLS